MSGSGSEVAEGAARKPKSHVLVAFLLWVAGVLAFIVFPSVGGAITSGSWNVLPYIFWGSAVSSLLLVGSVVVAAGSTRVVRRRELSALIVVLAAFSLPLAGFPVVVFAVALWFWV